MSKLQKLSESYTWVSEIGSRMVIELKKTHDMLEEIFNRCFQQYGISNAKFNMLVLLYREGDQGLMLSELGEKMLVTKSNITGMVDRLEKQGFVKRVRDDGDRRIIKAVMTGKGREFTVNIIEKYREWTEKIMEILDENEKNCMINVLRKLQKGLVEF